ncbi:MAG: hypothetical protein IPO17_17040 [Flavobacteriales bacterium]|nr:hypothetical protein [Flavobacteriales bacterium]
MRNVSLIAVLLLVGCGSEQEQLVERALRHGAARYNDGQFTAADSSFAEAPLDERAVFNRGNANFRMRQWTSAIAHFREAAAMDSSRLEQDRARFNLGNAHLAEALLADTLARQQQELLDGIRVEGSDIATKVSQFVLRDSIQRDVQRLQALIDSSLTAALEGFRASLRNQPTDDDARYNFAYVQRLISRRPNAGDDGSKGGDGDKDKELSARAQQIMKRAGELVEQYKFEEALSVMQQGLKEDPSLKAKKEYMDKLDVVTKAAKAT